jgi:hypothetical protein
MFYSFCLPTVENLVRKSVSNMKSEEEESVMRTFIGQTRDLSECSKWYVTTKVFCLHLNLIMLFLLF